MFSLSTILELLANRRDPDNGKYRRKNINSLFTWRCPQRRHRCCLSSLLRRVWPNMSRKNTVNRDRSCYLYVANKSSTSKLCEAIWARDFFCRRWKKMFLLIFSNCKLHLKNHLITSTNNTTNTRRSGVHVPTECQPKTKLACKIHVTM